LSEIYNMHCHIFPGKIAEKAVGAIGNFYDIKMQGYGTSDTLIEEGKKIGITKYLVCSTATKSEQVESINNFVAFECSTHPEFIGFGSLHPDYTDIEAETARILSLGLKGIKLHPDFQKFNIDDPSAYPIYEWAEKRNLPILIHMGDNRYDYSKPYRLLNILEKFPKLIVIGAHLGGYRCWEEALNCTLKRVDNTVASYIGHDRLFIDTSSSLMFISPEMAANIIHTHGIDKVFFGTDFPMWDHIKEYERFNKIPLSTEEKEKLLYKNAVKFINTLN